MYEFGLCPAGMGSLVSLRHCLNGEPYLACEFSDEAAEPAEDFARLPFADGAAGTVICLNLLDRVADPAQTMHKLRRLLRAGGTLLVASSRRGKRSAPPRLRPRLLQELLAAMAVTVVGWQGRADDPHSIYGLGLSASPDCTPGLAT